MTASPLNGATISHYRVLKPLGAGGIAAVVLVSAAVALGLYKLGILSGADSAVTFSPGREAVRVPAFVGNERERVDRRQSGWHRRAETLLAQCARYNLGNSFEPKPVGFVYDFPRL